MARATYGASDMAELRDSEGDVDGPVLDISPYPSLEELLAVQSQSVATSPSSQSTKQNFDKDISDAPPQADRVEQMRRVLERELICRYDRVHLCADEKYWWMIPSSWLKAWMRYMHGAPCTPGRITFRHLLDDNENLKRDLQPVTHYRAVNVRVWVLFANLYGIDDLTMPMARESIDIYAEEPSRKAVASYLLSFEKWATEQVEQLEEEHDEWTQDVDEEDDREHHLPIQTLLCCSWLLRSIWLSTQSGPRYKSMSQNPEANHYELVRTKGSKESSPAARNVAAISSGQSKNRSRIVNRVESLPLYKQNVVT